MSTQRIYNFMGQRKLAAVFSVLMIVASIWSLSSNGLVLGLDFTGGTQIEVGYDRAVDTEQVRAELNQAGFDGAVVIHYGSDSDLMVRLQLGDVSNAAEQIEDPKLRPSVGDQVVDILSANGDKVELRREDTVGPQIGEELRDDGGLGMLAALAIVMLYVAVRFQYKFSVGAVSALIHDVIITLGIFSIFKIEFDLTVLAAVLAVIGYSLNDTIVVSDRIRENFRLIRKATPVEVINESLTQTLGRTIITSLTTVLVLLALFYWGGELIHNFSLALLIGVTVGTYSSIYVAANILLMMDVGREDLMPQEREQAEIDDLP
jgi:preprotein translocase subunit SecF